jgi:hypothetical protein
MLTSSIRWILILAAENRSAPGRHRTQGSADAIPICRDRDATFYRNDIYASGHRPRTKCSEWREKSDPARRQYGGHPV